MVYTLPLPGDVPSIAKERQPSEQANDVARHVVQLGAAYEEFVAARQHFTTASAALAEALDLTREEFAAFLHRTSESEGR